MMTTSRPARLVAFGSLFLSIIFACLTILLGRWSGFFAVFSTGFFFVAAALIWLVLLIQFYQRQLAEQEKLDMTGLTGDQRTDKIFQAKGEQAQLFAVAQKRLQIFEKWFLPIFSALIALYQVAMGFFLLRGVSDSNPAVGRQPLLCAVSMAAVFFVSFLISKYATGMSTKTEWKPLRGGGSFLFGSAVLTGALVAALALVQFKIFIVIKVIDFCVPALLILLGLETLINVILDIYRPRMPGYYSRAAFDSRLLGLINEPGEILHTAAGVIDYQFGFQVSQTWFYKLLGKAVIPLVFFSALSLYLLTCVVVINPDEQAIVEHFGSPKDASGNVRLLDSGIHFKLPWPIDIAKVYPSKKIVEIPIGFVPKTDPKTGEIIREPLLWGKDHYKQEFNILVASRGGADAQKANEGAAPVSILKANIPVQYTIKNLYEFLYNNDDAQKRLEAICYRELAKFAAGSTIEVDDEAALQSSLLGAGRTQAKEILTKNIQAAADKAGLGVQIVFLGIQGIHPPSQVAADYEKVVGAIQRKQAIILNAEAGRNRTLTELAGSVDDAKKLYSLAAKFQREGYVNDNNQSAQLDLGFTQAGGDIFALLRIAKSDAFEKVTIAEATGKRFASQVKAFHAAEDIYRREQRLTALEEGLQNLRKYVVATDYNDSQLYIVDLQEKLTPSLYELGASQEQTKK